MPKPGQSRNRAGQSYSTDSSIKQSDFDYLNSLNNFELSGREYLGKSQMLNALTQLKLDRNTRGFITRDINGNPVGVLSYTPSNNNGMFSVNFVGTRGNAKGVGTSLMKKVAKQAAKKNSGLTLTSDYAAVGFYKKLGFSSTDGETFTMTAAKTKAFAK